MDVTAPDNLVEEHYLKAELEGRLRDDPLLWRFFQQASLDGIWYRDLEKPENEYLSPEFWRTLGYDPANKKHLVSEWQDLIDPDDLEAATANLHAHLNDPDHPYDQIVRYRCADGATAWLRCRGMAIRDEDGRAIRLVSAHNDLTDQKNQELVAQKSHQLLNQIMDTTEGAIIALGFDGYVLSINRAGRRLLGDVKQPTPFGWPDDIRFVDDETYELLPDDRHPIVRSLSGATVRGEISVMTRAEDDEQRYVRVSSSPVDMDDGDICCVLVIDDVSEQEKHRQQVERTNRLDALGQLTGGIAHDFNNLLATVQYALQLASQNSDEQQRQVYLDTAMKSVERGAQLTRRLLTFAKRQPGLATSGKVSEVIYEFEKLAKPLIEANIRIDFAISDPDLWVYCDLPQLENALLNLLLNARDAIQGSGQGNSIVVRVRGVSEIGEDITLRSEHAHTHIARQLSTESCSSGCCCEGSAARYIEFSVTDNGAGMSADVKRRAIDPFFTTKSTNSGTGLGLSMVYGFVQQSNGELRIYSEPGHGTTVRLLLPRGTEHGTREQQMSVGQQHHGNGETILVVEDQQNLLMMMDMLVHSLGYRIKRASASDEVLKMIEIGEHFDLMITDVIMPGGLDGFELAREVRSRLPGIPILYMSGYTGYTESDMADVIAPMLEKPCPADKLANAIHSALTGQPARQLIHQ